MNVRTPILTLSVTLIAVAVMAVPCHAQLFGGGGLLGGGGGFRGGGFGGGRPFIGGGGFGGGVSDHASFTTDPPIRQPIIRQPIARPAPARPVIGGGGPRPILGGGPAVGASPLPSRPCWVADPLQAALPEAFFPVAIVLS